MIILHPTLKTKYVHYNQPMNTIAVLHNAQGYKHLTLMRLGYF